MTWLYCGAILLGSCLLFLAQPMCAKMLLPLLGGTPAVWNTCMVFFQAGLLAGYAYAHALPGLLGVGRHAVLHVVALTLVYFILPIRLPVDVGEGWHPVLWLLASLTASVGLPFVLLAAGAPLLQRWYADRDWSSQRDPYFLYAASNVGSFLALAIFPFVLEPFFSLNEQSEIWMYAYFVVVVLMGGCIPLQIRLLPRPIASKTDAPTWKQRGQWIMLALIPSSLLLSVTAHLTTDIAAIPLLWLIPMALYLLTFTIVFARKDLVPLTLLRRWLPLVVIVVLLVMLSEAAEPLLVVVVVHLVAFFWLALVCHGELARTRPPVDHLTDFYLCLAIGGVLGGALNALIAPLVFNGFVEYPLMIVLASAFGLEQGTRPTRQDWLWAAGVGAAAVLLILAVQSDARFRADLGKAGFAIMLGLPLLGCYLLQKHPARFALAVAAVLLAGGLMHGATGVRTYATRSYYGVHRVTEQDGMRCLVHGNTIHGRQNIDPEQPEWHAEPLTYYSKVGPIGEVFTAYRGDTRLQKVGLVGLGAGSLAAYSEPGQEWTFFEIDPTVKRIAENPRYFTFLRDAKGKIHFDIGDARLQLKKSKATFGVLVIDAFGSDSIPVHLLTREAMKVYLGHLEPDGLIAFHISNNYVDLEPVLANLARDAKPACTAVVRSHRELSDDEKTHGIAPSEWLVLARRPEDLAPLHNSGNWEDARPRLGQRVWTDDFSNLLPVFRWRK